MLPQFIPKSPASLLLLFFIASLSLLSCNRKTPSVLIFSKTEGFTHDAIPDGIEAIMKLGQEHGFDVDTTTNAALFTEEHLQNYSAIIFLNTTGNVLNPQQETEMQRYIQSGGGFVGVHAAADTEYHWGWYGRLVGGYFLDHPGINDPHPNVQPGTILVADPNHPSTEFLPERWERTDEWYSYRDIYEEVNVLLKLDEQSYQGGGLKWGIILLPGIMSLTVADLFTPAWDIPKSPIATSYFCNICWPVLSMQSEAHPGRTILLPERPRFPKRTGLPKPSSSLVSYLNPLKFRPIIASVII